MPPPCGEKKLKKGDLVLVTGGNGNIGRAVVEIAKVAGARKIYSVGGGSESDCILCGNDPDEWGPAVRGKLDIVIDSVCSNWNETITAALNGEGKLVCIGELAKLGSEHDAILCTAPMACVKERGRTTENSNKIFFYDLFSEFSETPSFYEKDLKRLFRMLKDGAIKPVVAKRISLQEVADAHVMIERGGMNGTIVCLPFGFESPERLITISKKQQFEKKDELKKENSSSGGIIQVPQHSVSHSMKLRKTGLKPSKRQRSLLLLDSRRTLPKRKGKRTRKERLALLKQASQPTKK